MWPRRSFTMPCPRSARDPGTRRRARPPSQPQECLQAVILLLAVAAVHLQVASELGMDHTPQFVVGSVRIRSLAKAAAWRCPAVRSAVDAAAAAAAALSTPVRSAVDAAAAAAAAAETAPLPAHPVAVVLERQLVPPVAAVAVAAQPPHLPPRLTQPCYTAVAHSQTVPMGSLAARHRPMAEQSPIEHQTLCLQLLGRSP
mmetsp:Transcript_2913/g.4737  ORF Transcript_2913/g.4737 Transcript_2913/m.4737 type:complete len:200 (+) Transcript_2913:157-756(+)